ncbi:MAG: pilin [Candidatus Nomurabacteria bacterium]|jgi:TRAP-type C4-dicarboxylate transport system permease small subunit|nr:pilin [Candidatus Nomurabacteria bacterium]
MNFISLFANSVTGGVDDAINNSGLGDRTDITSPAQILVSAFISLIGLVAIIMIILGGIQYSTSQGDTGKLKKAKDTIMYGIIGLVVAILAFSIVNFVLASIF